MNHIAIDLGGRKSQICARDEKGAILSEGPVSTDNLTAKYFRRLPTARVIVETCAEAFSIADSALQAGHQVRVVPATLVRSLGVGARKLKNDKRDARVLSEVSCRIDLPSVHIPAQRSRDWKSRCGMRDALVKSRRSLINNTRGWLRAGAIRIRTGATKGFPSRVREKFGADLPNWVERQLVIIDELTMAIEEASQELKELASANDVCCRLMTVPGVGPITAIRFASAIDDVSRFQNAHELESYIGLVPGENSSSERRRLTSINKAGPSQVRWLLVEASWCFLRTRPDDPAGLWASGILSRRGKQIAAVALARKLAGILFAIWRDGTTYDPNKASRVRMTD